MACLQKSEKAGVAEVTEQRRVEERVSNAERWAAISPCRAWQTTVRSLDFISKQGEDMLYLKQEVL